MKTKKILSMLMVCVLLFGSTFTVANAETTDISNNNYAHVHGEMVFVFEEDTPEYVKNRIISDFTDAEKASVETRGLTCTLFGHDLDTGTTTTMTHKARATTPRCLQERFSYEVCSRCDYSNYTLIDSEYIYCCS